MNKIPQATALVKFCRRSSFAARSSYEIWQVPARSSPAHSKLDRGGPVPLLPKFDIPSPTVVCHILDNDYPLQEWNDIYNLFIQKYWFVHKFAARVESPGTSSKCTKRDNYLSQKVVKIYTVLINITSIAINTKKYAIAIISILRPSSFLLLVSFDMPMVSY